MASGAGGAGMGAVARQVTQEAAGMNFDDALQHVMNFDRAATQA